MTDEREPHVPENAPDASDADEPPWPVGFLILVGLAALYLGWRVVQLLARAVDWVL